MSVLPIEPGTWQPSQVLSFSPISSKTSSSSQFCLRLHLFTLHGLQMTPSLTLVQPHRSHRNLVNNCVDATEVYLTLPYPRGEIFKGTYVQNSLWKSMGVRCLTAICAFENLPSWIYTSSRSRNLLVSLKPDNSDETQGSDRLSWKWSFHIVTLQSGTMI